MEIPYCGINCFCDKMVTRRQLSEEIVYFEDEELDAYKGIAADAYTKQQVAEFEEVLTTMRAEEVPEWLHSLHLRGISLPKELELTASQIIHDTNREDD